MSKEKDQKAEDEEIEEILNAGRHIKRVQSELAERLDDLKVRVDDLSMRAQEHISDRPLVVLGTVFMIGLVVGVALSEIRS